MLALTHAPSRELHRCQLTFVPRHTVDVDRLVAQHRSYQQMLESLGFKICQLAAFEDEPDAVFVEDTAIVLPELAISCSMGADARLREPSAIAQQLTAYRDIARIARPARIEGGDVLCVGRTLLVGRSSRTDAAGIAALRSIVEPLGYRVRDVAVHRCLHLKTGCTAIDEQTLIVNRDWVEVEALEGFELLDVPPDEPWGANVLKAGGSLCLASEHQRTAELLDRRGCQVITTPLSEFAKAEGGATCLSLLID